MKAPELLGLAIEWLKTAYPDSIIVPEMSVADWGGALIDVAAITPDEVVGIEIKGEGDSPSRLDLQGLRYGRVARRMWLLVTPEGTLAERCEKKRPKGWGHLELHDGRVRPENRARKLGPLIKTKHGSRREMVPDLDTYEPDEARENSQQCAWAMCGTLWRDELHDLATRARLAPPSRMRVQDLTDLICSKMPVPDIHEAMMRQLWLRDWAARKQVIDLRQAEGSSGFANRKAPNRPIQGNLLSGV